MTHAGFLFAEEGSLLEVSPIHGGVRRTPSAVFARAQRDILRPPMTAEDAGDIAQVHDSDACHDNRDCRLGRSELGSIPATVTASASGSAY